MIKISMIAAVAENNAIGKDNKLLCYIPEDLKRFKAITSGNTVIMGRKTWESLKTKPLTNRDNIIITHLDYQVPAGIFVAHSIEEALKFCSPSKENFVIGGETIYRAFLPLAQTLYITKIHAKFEADTFFPEIDSSWKLESEEPGFSEKELPFGFSFVTYRRPFRQAQ